MAESMIERVARAIAKADATSSYEELARVAIDAMRSAPELLAADLRLDGQHIASYHDIIDAALNEQVSG